MTVSSAANTFLILSYSVASVALTIVSILSGDCEDTNTAAYTAGQYLALPTHFSYFLILLLQD